MSFSGDELADMERFRENCFALLESLRGILNDSDYWDVHRLIDANEPDIAMNVLALAVVQNGHAIPTAAIRKMRELGEPDEAWPPNLDDFAAEKPPQRP